MALLLTLDVCFLSHHSYRLIGSLDLDSFNVSDRNAVNHGCLRMFGLFPQNSIFFRLDCLCGEVSSSACICKALIHSLRLAHSLMVAYYVLRCNLLSSLIWNSLQLLVLHLPGDSLTGIFGHRIVLITQQLLLYRFDFIIDSVTVKNWRVSNSN